MLATMPHRVWQEWLLYMQQEPFGEERADLRAAIIASTMANLHGRRKGQKPFPIQDFMPDFRQLDPGPETTLTAQSPDQLLDKIMALKGNIDITVVDKREDNQ